MSSGGRQLEFAVGAVHNRRLFPDHFLTERLPEWREFAQLDVTALLADLRSLWEREADTLQNANEAQTEDRFIQPVLRALGLHYTIRPEVSVAGTRREPDYALFLTDEERQIAAGPRAADRYTRAIAICEAKRFDRPLDRRRAEGAPSEDPVAQIIHYVSITRARWGILTNGHIWRLYAAEGDLVEGACYEVDLVALLEGGDPRQFRYFAGFFSAGAFRPDESGHSFLDRALAESRASAVQVGEALERQVFAAVPMLADGLLGEEERTEPALSGAFEHALVLLYRLLFCLHAEARGLLPTHNPHYFEYSLRKQKQGLAEAIDRGRVFSRHSDDLYNDLRALFRIVDRGDPRLGVNEYDGGLFSAQRYTYFEGRAVPDERIAPALDGLYRVGGDFVDYRDLSVRHLGTIYERLLAYRLHEVDGRLELTEAEGRRESGSYFTPTEIVDLIVERTLDPLLRARSQAVQQEALRDDDALEVFLSLKVLDPAMGSGHFLVSAAAQIARYIANDPSYGGDLDLPEIQRLVAERCLYGVDLNPMAVELAQLSLWLTTVVGDEPLTFLANLRTGNSLVGADLDDLLAGEESVFAARLARDAEQMLDRVASIRDRASRTGDDVHEKERLSEAVEALSGPLEEYADETLSESLRAEARAVFHWELEFPEVFLDSNGQPRTDGGFDAIVGNPPYIRIQALGRELAAYSRQRYATAFGSFDAYIVFVERGLELLQPNGRLGFIVPNKFAKLDHATRLRERFIEDELVEEVLDFGDSQLFAGATNYTCVLLLDRQGSAELVYRRMPPEEDALRRALVSPERVRGEHIEVNELGSDGWLLVTGQERRLLREIEAGSARLDEVTAQIFQGLITSADPVFVVEDRGRRGENRLVYSRASDDEIELEPDLLHRLASGVDVDRYAFQPLTHLLLFPYRREDGEMQLLTAQELDTLPLTLGYLRRHEEALRGRERGRMDREGWYAFGRTQSLAAHDLPKLGVAATVRRLEVAADPEGEIYFHNVRVNGILRQGDGPSIWLLLVLLNSRLLDFVFRRIAAPHAGGHYAANKQFIAPLPIRLPSGADAGVVEELGRRLNEAAAMLARERRGFLDWLTDDVGAPLRTLAGRTRLERYDDLSAAEIMAVLRQNRNRLDRDPDSRAFRDTLERERAGSRDRLGEGTGRLRRDEAAADALVYELYGLSDRARALVDAEYGD